MDRVKNESCYKIIDVKSTYKEFFYEEKNETSCEKSVHVHAKKY